MMTEEQIIALMSSELLATDLTEWALGEIWDIVLENCTSYGLAIKVGQGLGKFFSKILFSTDKVIENYYEMNALYDFENILREVVKSYKSSYSSSKTENNAKHFNAAYEMLLSIYGLGTDVSLEHAKINNEDGVNLFVSYVMNKHDKYEIFKNTMKTIKDELDFIQNYANGDLYNSYLEDCCSTTSNVISLTPVTVNASQEQYVQTNEDLTQNIILLCDRKITNDMTLSSDYETFGNLYFSGGTINLNGYTLTVGGNLIQSSGAMQIHGGTLNVNGDYRIQTFTETINNGEALYTYSSGTLNMTNDYDAVNIEGSFYNESVNFSSLSKGKMEIQGDFYQLSNNSGYSDDFYCSGSHSVVFKGIKEHIIRFDSDSSCFNSLTVEGSAKWSGWLRIIKLESDIVVNTSKINLAYLYLEFTEKLFHERVV